MIESIQIKLQPAQAQNKNAMLKAIALKCKCAEKDISDFAILKRSIDARGKNIFILLSLEVYINEQPAQIKEEVLHLKSVKNSAYSVIIIGAGPAGLFAALELIEQGIKPIILERGKDVKSRRRDLAILNRGGLVNPESNYCFGEGGAGTYSDGKLYTRSQKRGNVKKVLQIFTSFGAPEQVLYDAHPHIGTNKLPQIIVAMREAIQEHGGEIHFEKKLTDIIIEQDAVKEIVTADGTHFTADAYILATGHSARDIFYLFAEKKLLLEAKPFALGVRIEHPQAIINKIQYGKEGEVKIENEDSDTYLPPASYSLVQQVNGRGVFSFCMCPGGIIAPAATAPGEIVVNGWSPSKRNNPFANSGMVVQVLKEDVLQYLPGSEEDDPLLFLKFQQAVEQKCFEYGGGDNTAPAQRMIDFTKQKLSESLPVNSYKPGLKSCQLNKILPPFINEALVKGFVQFGKKLKGFYTNEAVVVATESRTSSPVRIPRDEELLTHPQLKNLYPCGEGAGYAGGIVSAALDGQRVAAQIRVSLG